MYQGLEGKSVIVTGAGSGIGLSTSKMFHAAGARVVLADVSGNEQQVASELGERALAVTADVRRDADVKRVIATAVESHGGIDVLCNIAGVAGVVAPLADTAQEDFDLLIDINLRGVFLFMKNAIPHMVAGDGGAIVNMASTAGIVGTPNLCGYAASKAGVVALTKVAALEYARQGLRVNAVCPGVIRTPMIDSAIQADPSRAEFFEGRSPIGRLGTPEETVTVVLFLASDSSSFVNGAVVPVDGGRVAG